MGYLSQKKYRIRQNIFFHIAAVGLIVLTAGLFSVPERCYGFFNLFHLFCLSGLLAIGAVWAKKYRLSLVFAAVWVICYMVLGSIGNIFLSDGFKGDETVELAFAPQKELTSGRAPVKVSSGILVIARKYLAPYEVIGQENPLTLVKVDFRHAQKSEYPLIFAHLREFILKQDNPVIIFGEFGIPVWNAAFKHFLDKSGLKVKNRLLFTKGSEFNILSSPEFYVLGFREMGIANIHIDENGGQKNIFITVSFNSAHS